MEQNTPSERRPALRNLDVNQQTRDGQPGVVLTDPLGISNQQVFVPEGLLPIVSRFDGQRTVAEIEAELTMESGQALPEGLVTGIADQFDECEFLDSKRFREAMETRMAEFTSREARPAIHAGVSAGYPGTREACSEVLESMVRKPGPGEEREPTPRGLVAPHIDLARGREGYAMAYGALAEREPADLYVVFGTGHQGPRGKVTGLPMDWETPVGTMPTDREFVAAIHERIGPALPGDLFLHRQEHSLEFQMLFLRHVLGDHPAKVAGFLTGHLPEDDPEIRKLLDAFTTVCAEREAAGQKICFVAGADLAHIGPEFGDAQPIDDARLERLTTEEKGRLAHLEQGDPSAFHHSVEEGSNPDRICGTTPMFLTGSLAGGAGELLHYGQANAPDGSLTVSYCGMLFPGK